MCVLGGAYMQNFQLGFLEKAKGMPRSLQHPHTQRWRGVPSLTLGKGSMQEASSLGPREQNQSG